MWQNSSCSAAILLGLPFSLPVRVSRSCSADIRAHVLTGAGVQVSRLARELPSRGGDLKSMSAFLNSQMHEGEEQGDEGQDDGGEDGSDFLT